MDQESLDWKIKTLRNAIASAWAELATEGLTYEQRKAIRIRLQADIKALRETVEQNRSASDPAVRNIGANAVKNAFGL